ncbi:unnamed protein product [Ilex paraguariensis]|uniref:Pentatricopeptide repeat-containing protein n=1 Tax=Ilex paraguariensis TaxID=185542 RepID=A0ABC8RZD7_9AQUA
MAEPDGFAVVCALLACGWKNDLLNGRVVHGMNYRYELGCSEPIVGNALIDMYSRNGKMHMDQLVFGTMEFRDVATWTSLLNGFILCDDMRSAGQLFEEMPQKNTISWTAMIVGYVRGKSPIWALELFQKMRVGGEDHPTSITIVSVLAGCADLGALDFGQSIHGYVYKFAGLVCDIAVNNGLIDLYSKSGSLGLATKIFRGMLDKDLLTWTPIISGLALHGEGRYALE